MLNLVSCKDIPFKTEPKYKPIFARLEFVDGTKFKTDEFPQAPVCKFGAKFFILLGKLDPILLRE